ncbi:DUF2169 domain-containing protein [Orbaceae bacterium ac157xtp]
MDFRNLTPFTCQYWYTLDKNGDQQGVLTVKAVFDFVKDEDGWCLKLKQQQEPLITEDSFFGEMNFSSVQYESEYIPKKPVTDVILNATAYAPEGFNRHFRAGILVNDQHVAMLEVTGKRHWQKLQQGLTVSQPEGCESVPIRYEKAFGGVLLRDESLDTPLITENVLISSPYNPIGCGLTHPERDCDGAEFPQLLWAGDLQKITDSQLIMPAGFGHFGRGWQPRIAHAGTFDDQWLAERHPLLPLDFDSRHYNSAHPRLQMKNYLEGNEIITLLNLDPRYKIQSFALPGYRLMWRVELKSGSTATGILPLDTLFIDINQGLWNGQVTLCWRSYWAYLDDVKTLTAVALPPQQSR